MTLNDESALSDQSCCTNYNKINLSNSFRFE